MNRVLIASLMLLVSACVSAPKRMDDIREGHWKAKALIKDKEQSRSYIVNMNLNATRETEKEKARMDVTSALGTGVASLVLDEKEVRYVLFDSKRFYFGQPTAEVMRPILSIPFDPRWLHNILFEIPLPGKSWTCVSTDGWLSECKDTVTGVKVTWSQRTGPRKTILIEHTKASVQINVSAFEPKVEDRKNLFVLEAPQGYQKLRVR